MANPSEERSTSAVLVRQLAAELSPDSRDNLRAWAEQLLTIRQSDLPPLRKTRLALRATYRKEVMLPLASSTGAKLKDLAWDDRSWSARLGIGAAAATAATLGSQGAGIAAMGGAIGVPLWIVFGAGASFAGMLIDELSSFGYPSGARQEIIEARRGRDYEIIDAEVDSGVTVPPGAELPQLMPVAQAKPSGEQVVDRDPLWQVFKRAYRKSRARHVEGD